MLLILRSVCNQCMNSNSNFVFSGDYFVKCFNLFFCIQKQHDNAYVFAATQCCFYVALNIFSFFYLPSLPNYLPTLIHTNPSTVNYFYIILRLTKTILMHFLFYFSSLSMFLLHKKSSSHFELPPITPYTIPIPYHRIQRRARVRLPRHRLHPVR